MLITWPFTDLSSVKVRPAVVVSSDTFNRGADVILVAISSQTAKAEAWDVLARASDPSFARTGLRLPSVFKCGKILTLSKGIVRRRLGNAGPYLGKLAPNLKRILDL